MAEPFLEHTTSIQQKLISSVSVLDKEWNHNGGVNWSRDGFEEYIEALNEHLLDSAVFTEKELKEIEWAIREIETCGRELEENGESSRNAESAVYILRDRTIDWIRKNPTPQPTEEEDYLGHF